MCGGISVGVNAICGNLWFERSVGLGGQSEAVASRVRGCCNTSLRRHDGRCLSEASNCAREINQHVNGSLALVGDGTLHEKCYLQRSEVSN